MNNGAGCSSPQASGRIIIVDDERDFSQGVGRLLSSRFPWAEMSALTSAREALRELENTSVQVLMTDLRMPGMSGMELVRQALRTQPGLSVVVLTAYGTIETAVEALHAGAYDFLTKPIESEQLFRVVEKGLERSRLLEENLRLRQMVRQEGEVGLVGESEPMQRLKRTIDAVAQSGYTVLLRGESGTGKELAARLVHRLSPRSDKPFVAINCPSIPENLLESELFGHVKGAFTGADRDHVGLFAAADGGTVHLDEIGDISPAIQTKLLRFLQNGEVRPVGSTKSRRVDVRVVASTNQDLEKGLAEKTFREDLYYRLNVLAIMLPPLRERVEDIPLLARRFLRVACREMDLEEKDMAPEVMRWLEERSWPGNVRELQNFVRRLTVFCPDRHIGMDVVRQVAPDWRRRNAQEERVFPGGGLTPYKEAKEEVLTAFSRGYVRELLRTTKGNVSEAARISGLSRVALQKMLARTGERAARFRRED